MNVFTITQPTDLVKEYVDRGSFYIKFKVEGFWSQDPIYIWAHNGWRDGIKFDINWSTGGRDREELSSDTKATRNFALALQHAVTLTEKLEEMKPEFDKAMAEKEEREMLEAQQREDIRLAKVAADTPRGEELAKEIIESLRESALSNYSESAMFKAYRRGTDSTIGFKAYQTRGGLVRFEVDGWKVSKKDALKKLANSSHRSVIH